MKILVGIGVVILLLLILLIALPFLIDLNKYQDRYRPLIEEALNRKVELQDIRLTIWPRIGARIGRFVVLDDPAFRTGPFASLASLDVGVKLLPLLKGRVEVEEITLRDPVILVLKNSQGQLNISTIGAKPTGPAAPSKPEAPEQPAGSPLQALALFAVDRVSIDGGTLTYRDESAAKPTEYTVSQLEFLLTSVHLGASPTVHLGATILPYHLPVHLDGTFGPLVETLDVKSFTFTLGLGKVAVGLKGRAIGGNLDATINALQIDTADLPVALPLTKPVQIKDLHLTLHALYPAPPDTPLASQVDLTDLGLTLVMGGSAISIKGTATKGLANITAASASINSSDLPVAVPLAKPVEVKDLHVNVRAKYPPKEGTAPLDLAEVPNLGLTVALGSSRVEVKGSLLGGLAKVTATSKLVNTADLPVILPLKKPVEIKDLQAAAEMRGQEARLTNLTLQVFGGVLRTQGTLGLGTPTPPFTGTVALQGLQVGPALQAVGTDQVSLSGTANAQLALSGRGFTHPDLVKALAGTGRMSVKEGTIEGINLLQQAAMLLKVVGVSLDNVKATAFSTIESDIVIKQGLIGLQRVLIDSHDFQATGGGTVGLDQSLDMKLNLSLSQALSQKIAAGSPIAKVALSNGRLSLPLVITGSTQAPSYGLDTKMFAGKVQEQVKEKVKGAVGDLLKGSTKPEDLKKQGKDLLKGLFGR
ncbi:MAG: AsmA family protein [Nitrospira sp. CR1.1]|nr:AsmA family protein [Nitrospira sp. CR1.1]